MGNLKLASCMVLIMCVAVVLSAHTARAITCGQVSGNLAPCLRYLQKGGRVPPPCCAGVKNIARAARTTADRRAACKCLKSAAGAIRGIVSSFAESLPRNCGVSIPYKISTSTNCASIK
ncbi:Plant lipid transfer protein/Par allergen [Sesbania bispinosa]|nr:Plant lipid transfer protein/Par allergen [Sesbania bispinosa]